MKLWLLAALGVLTGAVIALAAFSVQFSDGQARMQAQLDQTRAELAQVSAKAAGAHRDLITCADLQGLSLQVLLDIGLNTNADGSLSAVPDEQPVQLPSHCINQ